MTHCPECKRDRGWTYSWRPAIHFVGRWGEPAEQIEWIQTLHENTGVRCRNCQAWFPMSAARGVSFDAAEKIRQAYLLQAVNGTRPATQGQEEDRPTDRVG